MIIGVFPFKMRQTHLLKEGERGKLSALGGNLFGSPISE